MQQIDGLRRPFAARYIPLVDPAIDLDGATSGLSSTREVAVIIEVELDTQTQARTGQKYPGQAPQKTSEMSNITRHGLAADFPAFEAGPVLGSFSPQSF